MEKKKYQENWKLNTHIRKRNIMKIVRYSWSIKSSYTKKIEKLKLNIKKGGTKKILKFIKYTEKRYTRNIRKITNTVTRLCISCKK